MSELRWSDPIKRSDLERCPDCGWLYPVEILSPFVSGDPDFNAVVRTHPICGVCALRRVNQRHGARLRKFNGTTAEDFRQDALAFRREHPEYAPKKSPPPPAK